MNLFHSRGLISIFTLFCIGLSGCSGNDQPNDSLEIVGTGACEVVLGKLAEAYCARNPGQTVKVPPSIGSSGGINQVGKGDAVLGRVARRLKEKEKHWELQYQVFSRDAVVFAVSANVGLESLSSGQLALIYSGKIINWKELGGPDQPIHLLRREEGDSSLSVIQKQLPTFADLNWASEARTLYHDPEMINYLRKYNNSIGFTTLSGLKDNPKILPLAIDGHTPSKTNIQSNKYPLVGEHAFVFRKSELTNLAHSFLDFVRSSEGEKVLIAAGLQPIGEGEGAH